jgi:hypothetical protein
VRRIDALLLAGVGILAIHQFAYATAAAFGAESVVGHGHLQMAWVMGSLAGVVVLAAAVTRSLRGRSHTPLGTAPFAALLAGGYSTLEFFERIADGYGPATLLSESVFWIGLLAVVPVAIALRASVQSVAEIVENLIRTATPLPTVPRLSGPPVFQRTSLVLRPVALRSSTVTRRGPPVVR